MKMQDYAPYGQELRDLLEAIHQADGPPELLERIELALDGGAALQLRARIPIEPRREDGIFFTPHALAEQAIAPWADTLDDEVTVWDPTCGAGDLLLACARRLPLGKDGAVTLEQWGRQLHGTDIHAEFVEAARSRLALAALTRATQQSQTPWGEGTLFPSLCVADSTKDFAKAAAMSHIMLNPPYFLTKAPKGCQWASGRVSAAALFVEGSVLAARPGTRIAAILPDVLRSGSFYERWRQRITAHAEVERVQIVGQFDPWTDVDVFILWLKVGTAAQRTADWWLGDETLPATPRTIADMFKVSVGTVVPYRDGKKPGGPHPYITPRLLTPWDTCTPERVFEGHSRSLFIPPFVAVRRTSRPGHAYRAVGTLVVGESPVAVENHLLVLEPKDGTQAICDTLLERLRRPATTVWLNQRIRCRHLTAPALRELPWWEDEP